MTAPKPVEAPVDPVSDLEKLFDKVRSGLSKGIDQALAFGGYYLFLAHTDFTKLENVVAGFVAATAGLVINSIRSKVKL